MSRRAAGPLWLAFALLWAAFAVVEGVNHGVGAIAAAAAGLFVPAAPVAGVLRRWASVPLILAVGYAVAPWEAPAAFAFLCGWLATIGIDRAFGWRWPSRALSRPCAAADTSRRAGRRTRRWRRRGPTS